MAPFNREANSMLNSKKTQHEKSFHDRSSAKIISRGSVATFMKEESDLFGSKIREVHGWGGNASGASVRERL